MSRKWTDEQNAAIVSRGQNLLLSAAAGSGKTSVLVGRIIERITNKEKPFDADKLLVVTFTNAAAAEMRERIISALTALTEEDPANTFLSNQLLLVKKAQITTIDSFCIDLLRKNFVVANLSPDFRIADPTENALMRDEVLDEILSEMYDDEIYSDDFFRVLESYANAKANDKMFRELINSIFLFATSLPNPDEWLKNAYEEFDLKNGFNETKWCKIIISEAKSEIMRAINEYDQMILLAKNDGFSAYEELLRNEKEQFVKALENEKYDELKESIDNIYFKTRPRVPKDLIPEYVDIINSMRDQIKTKRIKLLREKLLVLSLNQQSASITDMYYVVRCISEIVIRLRKRFLEKKLEKNILDFNDCEHICLKLLRDEKGNLTETALEIRDKYDEIYIDEYQDTSKLQETIFSSIKRENNLFMVGDIKQSIYRFRNTDPSLFKSKRDFYSKETDSKNRKIILSKNFRSNKNVISSVNYIFERIMSEGSGEIDYNEDEKLYLGADFPDGAVNPINSKTEVCILDIDSIKEGIEEAEKSELCAMVVADKISELIDSEEQVFINGEYRKIRFSDICVISRNVKDSAPILMSILSERGIPCFSENTGGFLNSSEIITILSMLSVIDNPYQDIPLLSVLRSIIFGFSADTLARIRCTDKNVSFYEAMIICAETDTPEGKSASYALSVIQDFIEKKSYLNVAELLLDIYNTTGFYDAQQTKQNGAIRRANLRLLLNRAKEYEKTGFKGLYSFIRFINDYSHAGGDFDAAKTVGSEQDAVRIMSIHKSKGLEFPVVILYAAEKTFNISDRKRPVLYHSELGYGPKYVDTKLRITYTFAPRAAVESVIKKENIAEEMRILYVALTRAKEKLIIIGAAKDIHKEINKRFDAGNTRKIPAGAILECNSYLDWILTALINHPDCENLRKMCDTKRKIYEDDSRFSVEIIDDWNRFIFEDKVVEESETKKDGTVLEKVINLLSYTYPRYYDTILPSKITVTELKRRIQELEEEGSVPLFPTVKHINPLTKKLTASQIGTAYHTVMQYIDLSKPLNTKEDVHSEIVRIKDEGFLTDEEAGAINPEKILKFFLSNAGKIVLSGKKVRREVMFGLLNPADKLLKEFKTEKEIMLQGIIDCVVENDNELYIIDYKTDKAYTPSDTIEKYKIQLECYKMAAERIFKKKVKFKILYLFDTDTGIII